ncbi:MAG: Peptidase S11 D-alanyl-D-alanine carboxypeptidase 1 [Candidatus Uhrbacteria bacterium GW2011_GWF2_41_16]|uniref:Peptidase S11 D-alanyl-D-alanine carboxypeptidase 1 n=2 Tax=Candidatus Uhriibacteriota TaxID=1752732 RepID=A0A0G0VA07_9BACT|nr:MAG: Peptidase S11 D-alanyl-D-alanine carboxypeptidase 1 [Candidatus Uhrbacteria bacterium GW2011_GWC2_41_11]KKR97759.1 MAG: Peptidase S11 D-alanyl-D-alanine carboxypeptidase 1 [Candidatus Uhrbacteria bacterium GW2011_GWF2_41_16]
MIRTFLFVLFWTISAVFFPLAVHAQTQDAVLQHIYEKRVDLQKSFDAKTGFAISGSAAGFLIDLEDWAKQYGWREYLELSAYKPDTKTLPIALGSSSTPVVTANAFIVIDRNSGLILAEHHANLVWPIASITKLMTADLLLESGTSLSSVRTIEQVDEVGGACLNVPAGTKYTLEDLLYAALVASANNAANAVARASGMEKTNFVEAMNTKAEILRLPHTQFVDPTGIETGNVSTPRELAKLAMELFARQDLRRYAGTTSHTLTNLSDGTTRRLVNSNWMLWKPQYDDVYVMSGKTGYLDESGWNLVVSLRPEYEDVDREILLVLFGADSRAQSFEDAHALVKWAWNNHAWTEKQ